MLNLSICMAENGRSRTLLWIVIGGGAFFLFVLAVFTLVYLSLHAGGDNGSLRASFGDKIGVVELEGVILDPSTVVQQVKKFGDDDSIKAIIIHVNSPGGGVAASEEIYREVKRVRDEKKKHIVASIETVGASGAYYVSSATNKIYADNGSVVGSIGVISEWVNYGDLLRWAKLKPEVLTVGEYKSTGDPYARHDPERTRLPAVADRQHVWPVRQGGRRWPSRQGGRHQVRRRWPGLDGRAGPSMHMIDQIADFEAAVDDTAKAVGITGKPVLVHPDKDRKTVLDLLFGDISQWLPTREKLLDQHTGFYYLWK